MVGWFDCEYEMQKLGLRAILILGVWEIIIIWFGCKYDMLVWRTILTLGVSENNFPSGVEIIGHFHWPLMF